MEKQRREAHDDDPLLCTRLVPLSERKVRQSPGSKLELLERKAEHLSERKVRQSPSSTLELERKAVDSQQDNEGRGGSLVEIEDLMKYLWNNGSQRGGGSPPPLKKCYQAM